MMGRKKYLEIEEKLRYIDDDTFDGPVDEVIQSLQDMKKSYPNHTKLRIWLDYGAWDNPNEYHLMGTRMETDDERDKRLAKARKLKEQKAAKKAEDEAKEKQELKRLIEKYGDELTG